MILVTGSTGLVGSHLIYDLLRKGYQVKALVRKSSNKDRILQTFKLYSSEAEALYTLLEQEVVPEFYRRDEKGVPAAWMARMRESMARLTPQFSATRSVREYTERYYLPAASAYLERAAGNCAAGALIANWRRDLEQEWDNLRLGQVAVETAGGEHVFRVQVYLNDIDQASVRIELYADGVDGSEPVRLEMARVQQLVGAKGGYLYAAQVPATRPAGDYTVRALPHKPGVSVPLESAKILWQR